MRVREITFMPVPIEITEKIYLEVKNLKDVADELIESMGLGPTEEIGEITSLPIFTKTLDGITEFSARCGIIMKKYERQKNEK